MVYTITVHLHANDDPASVEKLKAKLTEASRVYSNDKETISWFVMQSTSDPRDFTIVERYENEGVSLFSFSRLQSCSRGQDTQPPSHSPFFLSFPSFPDRPGSEEEKRRGGEKHHIRNQADTSGCRARSTILRTRTGRHLTHT